ncbi:protocadherin gamma-A10-like isoform X6 [Mauremys mutica]|uniref:protocadherin gamma-A10-like isoform X6 n=1 Tax=Mauremys mutica TaxID=74926 RepID=UPI001D162A61|nr:protocadherin gamma-A10-like isoform X6 [Mauremys mutica]
MAYTQSRQDCKRRVLCCCILITVWETVSGQIRYSIPEEMEIGSFVGNIVKDLGLDLKELSDREVSLIARGRTQYFGLNLKNGHLFVNERMDREQICGHIAKCVLNVEVLAENPVKLYRGEVEIKDINDNSPSFPENESVLEISEYTVRGTRFPLEKAHDPDVGLNSLQNYKCSQDSYFILNVETGDDGVKYPELILATSLDREHQAVHNLILTATDGGDPVKSGSSIIRIVVLDGNDNAPEFTQSVYKVSVKEDIPVGSVVLRVTASDRDEGIHAQIKYSFLKISERFDKKFKLDSETGDIQVTAKLDFEELAFYELDIQARDEGRLSAHCKVLIEIADVNNHIPEITVTSSFSPIAEDSLLGAVIAILNVHDRDSGENGEVTCSIIPESLPFKSERSFDNFYTVVTDRALDREQVSEYNITVIATDRGIPPLSSNKTFFVEVLDKNDNRPVFDQKYYTVSIPENRTPGVSVFHMKANDVDWKENARITYSIIEGDRSEVPLSSYISINSETGALYALRSFDYEQFREIRFQVQAQDGGSPPLSSNVSVTLFILDQNDNSPHILHPSFPTDGSTGVELAPRSSEPGYLVTKVVAVDADSGQNAWLSYQLLKATEPGLFSVGLHSGEIRTARYFVDKDALKQSLVVLVKDNGQPPLSATATVTVVVADSIPEILSDLSSLSAPADPQSSLTLYLVIAVASVSCLFFTFIIVLVALRLRRWRNSQLFDSSSVTFSGVPDSQFVGLDGVRAFLHTSAQEAVLFKDSGLKEFCFQEGSVSDILTGINPAVNKETESFDEETSTSNALDIFLEQAQPNPDWRFSQAQRPGTSGSQNGEEGGAWPNNQFDTEMLQAMILASANEAADGNSTLGGGAGTMGLSTRYGPQFTLQHVPDYRQNVYIPGSTATLSNSSGKRDGKSSGSSGGNKKKSGKKEKK